MPIAPLTVPRLFGASSGRRRSLVRLALVGTVIPVAMVVSPGPTGQVAEAAVPPTPAAAAFNAPKCPGVTDDDPVAQTSPFSDVTSVFGPRLRAYNEGRVVPLYDSRGHGAAIIVPICGVRHVAGVGPVSQWSYCTDAALYSCATTSSTGDLIAGSSVINPWTELAGNSRLSANQSRLIASLVQNGHSFTMGPIASGPDYDYRVDGVTFARSDGNTAQRLALQKLVSCISDRGSSNAPIAFCDANLPASEQSAMLAHTSSSPTLSVSAPSGPIAAGSNVAFVVTTNVFAQPITLATTPAAGLSVCGGAATISGSTLTVTGSNPASNSTVTVCRTAPASGSVSLTASATPTSLQNVEWNSSIGNSVGCQVYADFAADTAARQATATATIAGSAVTTTPSPTTTRPAVVTTTTKRRWK